MKKESSVIEIRSLDMKAVHVSLIGSAPLIMHAWSDKAKKMMLDAQTGKKAGKQKELKNPVEDFINSMYWLTPKPSEYTEEAFDKVIADGARFGFPLTSIKQASISAAYRMGWTKDKVSLRGAFFIKGVDDTFVEIKSDPPVMREDMVRIGNGSADIRYRGMFENWSTEFDLIYNTNGQYDLEAILNIINAGGTVCGIGEWRPERDGQYGMYHVG